MSTVTHSPPEQGQLVGVRSRNWAEEDTDDFEWPRTTEEAAKLWVVVTDYHFFDHRERVALGSWPILGGKRFSTSDPALEASHAR